MLSVRRSKFEDFFVWLSFVNVAIMNICVVSGFCALQKSQNFQLGFKVFCRWGEFFRGFSSVGCSMCWVSVESGIDLDFRLKTCYFTCHLVWTDELMIMS